MDGSGIRTEEEGQLVKFRYHIFDGKEKLQRIRQAQRIHPSIPPSESSSHHLYPHVISILIHVTLSSRHFISHACNPTITPLHKP